jgi:RND family efflux transporter MFP subunit
MKGESAESHPRRGGRKFFLLTVLVILGAGGWLAYEHFAGGAKAANGNGGGKAKLGAAAVGDAPASAATAAKPAERIATVRAEAVPRNAVLRLTGSLAADERAAVAGNASGIVAEVRVDRGSMVRKGDVLVQIDPTDAKNKLAEGQAMLTELKARLGLDDENIDKFNPEDQPEVRLAKASADLAASNLRRAKDLFAKKVISSEAYDQAETDYELAHQRYRQALFMIKQAYAACRTAMTKLAILEKEVADTTIRAPFDGWVAEKLVAVGEQVNSGVQATKIVTLVRIDPLRLLLTVPQQDIGQIEPGQRVKFRVDSYPDREFEARVRFIAPVVASDTRSMIVEAEVPNADGALRPGLFATAELELPKRQPEVFVPQGAVLRTGEVGRVFVVRDGVAHEQIVALGKQEGGKIEIRTGLKGDELLVAKPATFRDGDKVGQ